MSERMISVAIDGPAGAGKSTIARAVAGKLGFIYVDTGALYRAVGLYGLRKGVDTTSAEQMLPLLDEIKVEMIYVEGEQRVLLNGEDVSEAIRLGEASMAASNVSAIQGVRDFLFDLQKDMACRHNVVMDGRDIGTVVLPEAQVKIFLTATAASSGTVGFCSNCVKSFISSPTRRMQSSAFLSDAAFLIVFSLE